MTTTTRLICESSDAIIYVENVLWELKLFLSYMIFSKSKHFEDFREKSIFHHLGVYFEVGIGDMA